jgi:rod shape-determining protein MreB
MKIPLFAHHHECLFVFQRNQLRWSAVRLKSLLLAQGAREVYLDRRANGCCLGADLPVDDASGSMVVDVGGGTTEIAIISLNGIVFSESVRIGGDRFDEAIVGYVRRRFGTLIGDSTAERIKQDIGTAVVDQDEQEIDVAVVIWPKGFQSSSP